MKQHVDALVQAEMRSFKPTHNYLEKWPLYEPNFDNHPMLQAEWMRVCDQQPMPKMDTSRYQVEPPPAELLKDEEAWHRATDNAKAQYEHQTTRIANLELLQQYGAPLWRAHLNVLEAASSQLTRAEAELTEEIELVNRKRKAAQLAVGPRLMQMEAEWVSSVKKNLEIEAECLRLEAIREGQREAAEAKRRQQLGR